MTIFIEYKISDEAILIFLANFLNINIEEVSVFDDNYFYEHPEQINIDNKIKCICTYRYLNGDVKTRLELFGDIHQEAELMVKRAMKFFDHYQWSGFIVVENIDDDYLKISNHSVQSVYINDDNIEDDIVYFIDKN